MPVTFDFTIPPFERLTEAERRKLAASADTAYFKPGEVLFRAGEEPAHLYVLIKGLVSEKAGDEVVTVYGAGDLIGATALAGPAAAGAEVQEEAIAQLLPRRLLLDLCRGNPSFQSYFTQSIGERLAAQAAAEANRGIAPFMVAKVREANLHPPIFIAASATLKEAAIRMKEGNASSLLVRSFDGTFGVLTGTDLREAAIIRELPLDTPVDRLATYRAVTVDHDEFLYRAEVLMIRHGIRRLPVLRDGEVIGILEIIDLLGYVSSHSHLVVAQVERATGIDDLSEAARDLGVLIDALHGAGVKIAVIAEMVTDLNRRIQRRLFEFLASPELAAHACLVVMGSEGRGEQIARTDQDNALIVADDAPIDEAEMRAFGARFVDAMVEFGYPRCPGDMMVSNPHWAQRESDFRRDVAGWLAQPGGDSFINLAALIDGEAVAGDAELLVRLRRDLFDGVGNAAGFLSHFARPVLQFDTPIGFFHQILLAKGEHEGEIDVKKGGLFPIVHGVRALALERRIAALNTSARIAALADDGVLDRAFAGDLNEAFQFLMELRLHARLAQARRSGPASEVGDAYVRAADLSRLERDGLKDSLLIVKRFKEQVSHHFRLDAF